MTKTKITVNEEYVEEMMENIVFSIALSNFEAAFDNFIDCHPEMETFGDFIDEFTEILSKMVIDYMNIILK